MAGRRGRRAGPEADCGECSGDRNRRERDSLIADRDFLMSGEGVRKVDDVGLVAVPLFECSNVQRMDLALVGVVVEDAEGRQRWAVIRPEQAREWARRLTQASAWAEYLVGRSHCQEG